MRRIIYATAEVIANSGIIDGFSFFFSSIASKILYYIRRNNKK